MTLSRAHAIRTGRPRAGEIARRVPGGYEFDGLFYTDEEWDRLERRRETYRKSKARSRESSWNRPTPLMQSIAILYHFGLSSGQVANRLLVATGTVTTYLTSLSRYWGAESWRDAATLEWHAMQDEAA